MKKIKLSLLIIILLGLISTVNAHGADITDNVMVITNDTNGITAKKIVDELNLNITVYKFTSEADVKHQLEHASTNPNKRILIIAFQDTANNFLKQHKELSNQVIVYNNTNEENIKKGLIELNSTINHNNNINNININYTALFLTIIIIGSVTVIGIIYLKKKK